MNKLRKLFDSMTPDKQLSERIDSLIDSTPERAPSAKKAPRSKLRYTAIIAAAAIAIVSVSAYGLSRIYYLPGAGLVDEEGTLVIREDDIGNLEGVSAYKTPSPLDFGDYTIDSVTHVSYGEESGYAVWTTVDEAVLLEYIDPERDELTVPLSNWVLDDLTLTLPDGTRLTPESSRYSDDGMIVYSFAGDNFASELTLASQTAGVELEVKLAEVEKVGFSYMQYPTDRDITLMISPQSERFDSFDVRHINGALGELEDYVRTVVAHLPMAEKDYFAFIGSDGKKYTPTTQGWSRNSSDSLYPDKSYVKIKKPNDVDIVGVECSRLHVEYHLTPSKEREITLEMPADGERIDRRVTLFDECGIKVEITGWERKGSVLYIYSDGEVISEEDYFFDGGYLKSRSFPIESEHTSDRVFAAVKIVGLNTADKLDGYGYSGGGEMLGDGKYMRFFDFQGDPSLDTVDSFVIAVPFLTCEYNGNWSIEY